jgi:GT2 family glycosyltransferase
MSTSPAERNITLSIVSHGQNALVNALLEDVKRVCADKVALVLTENVPDPVPLSIAGLPCPAEVIKNETAKGFGANHNAAFRRSATPWFCVCNPDIRLPADPFPRLLEALADPRVAAAGPLVRSPEGRIEDSARRFPTLGSLAKKLFVDRREPDYPTDRGAIEVDWVAGMFMLFRSEIFRAAGGFDERYFLYYEDVDLCGRLRKHAGAVVYAPRAEVIHNARRSSRRSMMHALWHARSLMRYLSRRSAFARNQS